MNVGEGIIMTKTGMDLMISWVSLNLKRSCSQIESSLDQI